MSLRQIVVAAVAAVAVVGIAAANSDGVKGYKGWRSNEAVAARMAPVGKVYVEGDEIPNAAPVVVVAAGPRTGEAIYKASCFACHGTGAAGAPKYADKAAWAPRLKKGESVLAGSLKNGFNAMPPKGMCMDCSDDELKGVLTYMLQGAK